MLAVAELTKRGLQTKEIDLMGAGKKIPSFVFGQIFSLGSGGNFGKEKRLVQGIKNTFLLISGAAGKKLKKKLVDEQEIILNLSSILSEAYITESLLLKIQKLEQQAEKDAAHFSIQKKMMELYLYESLDEVRKAGKDAIASFATGFEKRTLTFLMGKMLKDYVKNPKELRREVADYVLGKKEYPF